MNGFKSSKWLNSYFLHLDGILTGTTTPGQSELEINCNEEVLYIPQSFKTGTSRSDV